MPLTKVVLSPCLFELMTLTESEVTEIAHLTHFQSILNFIAPLNVEFDLYENAPYYMESMKRPPISRYHYHNISCLQIYAKILKKICYDPVISLSKYSPSAIISSYDYPCESETKDSFLRYITYLFKNNQKAILFIGTANQEKPRPFVFQLPDSSQSEMMPISDPAIDCSHQLSEVVIIKECSELFPNAQMCVALNENFLARRKEEDRMSLIKEIGAEVASRNGYSYNKHLSVLNSQKQRNARDVYSRFGKSITFLSLDFESGGFEVFDHSGTHLGQFSFSGVKVKPASPKTHKLYFS